jgi:putative phosphoesterase
MIKAGILSDTHLMNVNSRFAETANHCFTDCSVIIHAGDLTDISLLQVFADKEIFAVHGNMCNNSSYGVLPREKTFTLGGFTFGLTHGAGLGFDIEAALWDVFPEADCVIYGHTHRPVCHRIGDRLIINPGSFQATGRYGAPGTYAVLEVNKTLRATIHEIPQLS